MSTNSKSVKKARPGLTKQFNSEYRSWLAMRQRCSNRRTVGWAVYGGRGIRVCDRWQNSFAAFLEDMGPKPSDAHSIDRRDPDGDYTRDNCRWATRLTQARNCRNNRYVTFDRRTLCVSEWAEVTGLSANLIRARLNLGWSPRKTLTTPYNAIRHDQRKLTLHGRTATVKEWAVVFDVNYTTILSRLDRGWDVEAALTTPCNSVKSMAGRMRHVS